MTIPVTSSLYYNPAIPGSRRLKPGIEEFEPVESVYAESMTYTITLPNVTRESASAIETNLRGVNGIDSVDIDVPSERAMVNSTLTYGEVLDAIRQAGVAAS
ncbi:hypothetical protein AB0H00_18725 [Nocardia sp. NPDC023852]|uniref:hypothetical protein n=2 Tax=unclassified Nocardia TaxID=2637762 RepID=UPI0033F0D8C0